MQVLVGGILPAAWQAWWRRLRNTLLDLLFPPRCAGCGQSGYLWCSACQAGVQVIRDPICPRCGRPQQAAGLCPQCSRSPLQLDGIRSAVLFEGPLRQAVHHLKYSGRISLAEPLGEFLRAHWRTRPLPASMLVPVPLHVSRQRERGYNQSTLLAQQLSSANGLPVVEAALKRVRATAPQVTLNAVERKTNVRSAFEACADLVYGQQVLLVDDVCTTGATLEACGIALREAGAVSVWAITLARAP